MVMNQCESVLCVAYAPLHAAYTPVLQPPMHGGLWTVGNRVDDMSAAALGASTSSWPHPWGACAGQLLDTCDQRDNCPTLTHCSRLPLDKQCRRFPRESPYRKHQPAHLLSLYGNQTPHPPWAILRCKPVACHRTILGAPMASSPRPACRHFAVMDHGPMGLRSGAGGGGGRGGWRCTRATHTPCSGHPKNGRVYACMHHFTTSAALFPLLPIAPSCSQPRKCSANLQTMSPVHVTPGQHGLRTASGRVDNPQRPLQ